METLVGVTNKQVRDEVLSLAFVRSDCLRNPETACVCSADGIDLGSSAVCLIFVSTQGTTLLPGSLCLSGIWHFFVFLGFISNDG